MTFHTNMMYLCKAHRVWSERRIQNKDKNRNSAGMEGICVEIQQLHFVWGVNWKRRLAERVPFTQSPLSASVCSSWVYCICRKTNYSEEQESFHKFLIELRSGIWLHNSNTRVFKVLNHSIPALAACLELLSYWKSWVSLKLGLIKFCKIRCDCLSVHLLLPLLKHGSGSIIL